MQITKILIRFARRILFGDKAHFLLNEYLNKQNRRITSSKSYFWCLCIERIIGLRFFKNEAGHRVTVNGSKIVKINPEYFLQGYTKSLVYAEKQVVENWASRLVFFWISLGIFCIIKCLFTKNSVRTTFFKHRTRYNPLKFIHLDLIYD